METPALSLKWIVLTLLLIFLGILFGYFLGVNYPKLLPSTISTDNPVASLARPQQVVKVSPLFNDQTTTIQAEIVRADNSYIAVKKDDLSETFPMSESVLIFHQKTSEKAATSSSDIDSIQLNREATIVLKVIDGEYKVISVSYLSPPPAR